jgi:hypothetical protein
MQKSIPGVGLFQCVVSHLLSYIQHALAHMPLSQFFASKLLLKSHLTKLNLRPVNGPKGKNGGGNASWPACASESLCVVKYGVNGMAKKKKRLPHTVPLC